MRTVSTLYFRITSIVTGDVYEGFIEDRESYINPSDNLDENDISLPNVIEFSRFSNPNYIKESFNIIIPVHDLLKYMV